MGGYFISYRQLEQLDSRLLYLNSFLPQFESTSCSLVSH
jgi:hypothetical protein